MQTQEQIPVEVLEQWGWQGACYRSITSGHINSTFIVELGGKQAVLQRVNPIFSPAVHFDIDAITHHLAKQGLQTPILITTRQNQLWHEDKDGGVWRLMTYIDGRTFLAVDGPQRSAAAAHLLGSFHTALHNLNHDFHFSRVGVHATAQHLEALERAVEQHSRHQHIDRVAPVAEQIFSYVRQLELPDDEQKRIVHGDPKISNVMFAPNSEAAICLVDLDTLAKMPLALELGDAFRSWCNPAGEELGAHFDLELFAPAFTAYCRTVADVFAANEISRVGAATLAITVELAARFCADALNENYFRWDATRFASATEHNLQRAQAQLRLAESISAQRTILETVVSRNVKAWITN